MSDNRLCDFHSSGEILKLCKLLLLDLSMLASSMPRSNRNLLNYILLDLRLVINILGSRVE